MQFSPTVCHFIPLISSISLSIRSIFVIKQSLSSHFCHKMHTSSCSCFSFSVHIYQSPTFPSFYHLALPLFEVGFLSVHSQQLLAGEKKCCSQPGSHPDFNQFISLLRFRHSGAASFCSFRLAAPLFLQRP
jgi:hypothetical protein